MATAKTITLTFRIEPSLKEALRTAANREHRSIANMVEVTIRDYCGRHSVTIDEQGDALFDKQRRSRLRIGLARAKQLGKALKVKKKIFSERDTCTMFIRRALR